MNITGYEFAQMNDLRIVLPNVNITGYYYPLSKVVWKNRRESERIVILKLERLSKQRKRNTEISLDYMPIWPEVLSTILNSLR